METWGFASTETIKAYYGRGSWGPFLIQAIYSHVYGGLPVSNEQREITAFDRKDTTTDLNSLQYLHRACEKMVVVVWWWWWLLPRV